MKQLVKIFKRIAIGIAALCVAALITVAVIFVGFRHKLDFDPANKNVNKIVVYGDVRSQHKVHMKMSSLVAAEKPDMVLFTGDMISNGSFLHWLIYTAIESKLWKNAEYYPTRGNHETNYLYYSTFLDLPEGKTFYSFDRSGMHFIVLDVIDPFNPADPEQIKWLEEDLKANADKPIAVSMHLPMFTSGKYPPYNEPDLRRLFKEYGVLFVFSAHVHSYEHSYVDGTHYVVTAGGGAPLYPETIENPYKVKRVTNYHYCVLTRSGDEYILTAKDIDGNVIDTFTASLKKDK